MENTVDKTRIRDGLAKLESQLKSLREKQSASFDEYKTNRDLQAIVERRLYVAIQVSIDIAMHIISENGIRKPESYSDAFVVLSEMDVVDTATSKQMEEEAGFRNVLTHEYGHH